MRDRRRLPTGRHTLLCATLSTLLLGPAAAFAAPAAHHPPPAAQTFAQAYKDAAADQRQAARAGFEASIDALPLLADHALFRAAQFAAEDDDHKTAGRHLERLLADHGESIWRGEALVLRGQLALDAAANAAALRHFDAALGEPSLPNPIPARLGRARALAALGRPAEAWPLALALAAADGAEAKAARDLREELAAGGATPLGVSAQEFALGLGKARLRTGDASEARAALAPLLTAATSARARAEAETLSAAAARAQGKTAAGDKLQAGLIARGKPADLAGNALYARARTAWNRNEDAAAKQDYALLLERFPGHARSADARHALARIAEAAGELARAATRYDEILQLHPGSRVAATAAWRRGFTHYLNGQPAKAAEAWHALGANEAGLYWRSRALAAMQRMPVARAVAAQLLREFPTSYYAWWLQPNPSTPSAADPHATASVSAAPLAARPISPSAQRHLDRAHLLHQLALPESAERELDAVRRATGSTRFLLQEYAQIGAWGRSIRIARLLESRGEKGLARSIHPWAHRGAFERAGAHHRIDPLLLASLSRRESLFEERARSPVGAFGLMQLMPATAAATAGRAVSREELAVATTNIDLGARYLRQLLDKYQGRIIPALAAYNGGPAAVARWQASYGMRPGDEFVERITYRETRRYVKAVLENYRIYRALYGATVPNPRLY
ncbi:MAG: transglycosylase SLT domain-containing protein [Deltaproteobacteria bacterium]